MKHFMVVCLILLLISGSVHAQEKEYGLAVLDLQANGIAATEALTLTDVLRSSILRVMQEQTSKVQGSYKLIERSQMDKIFGEFNVQNTGCTDVSCAIEFGKMLNAERIIIGSVGLVGSTYIVVARIVDVESSNTLVSVDRNVPSPIDNVIKLMSAVGHELLTGERLAVEVPGGVSATPSQSAPVSPVQQPAPTESFISVTGSPEGATVVIDDEIIGETPIDYRKIDPGRHTIKISKTAHDDHEEEIVVKPGATERMSYKLTPWAVLSISGSPDGATVSVDGKNIGSTPLDNHAIRPGRYEIEISRDGYIGHTESVNLSPGRERSISYALTALGSITVTSLPEGATVFIDGKEAGVTPLVNVTAQAGSHTVKIVKTGFETYSTSAAVGKGDPASISWMLIPKTKQKVLKRSLILPGSGQWYAGNKGKGALITALQIGTIGLAVATTMSASSAIDDYDTAKSNYLNATTGADFSGLYSELASTHDSSSSAQTMQMVAIGAVVAVYIYNVIDAMRTEPNVDVNPKIGTLDIAPEIGKDYAGLSMHVRF